MNPERSAMTMVPSTSSYHGSSAAIVAFSRKKTVARPMTVLDRNGPANSCGKTARITEAGR